MSRQPANNFKIMDKILKTILLISITALGLGVLAVPQASATTGNVIIHFQYDPLFDKANFLPGEAVDRWVEVTNNTAEAKTIKVKFTSTSYSFGASLADVLQVVIKKNDGTELHNKTLTQFFNAGELVLSQLAVGVYEKYTFSITFLPLSENQYQEQMVGFDLSVGTFGEGGQQTSEEEVVGGGGGGGGSAGGSYQGLEIYNEKASGTDPYSVTITWETNKEATSRVIYSSADEPHTLNLSAPPNYGYSHSTVEDGNKVYFHSVVISGLQQDMTYFYRCVSRGSDAISVEHSFTTPGTKKTVAGEETFVYEGTGSGPAGAGEGVPEELPEGSVKGETTGETAAGQEESGMGLGKLLAAIGNFFGSQNLCWLLLLLIIILIVLFLLSVAGKKPEKKKQWILPLIILILIILYSFLSCANYLWLVIIISLSAILFLILRKRLTKPASTEQP